MSDDPVGQDPPDSLPFSQPEPNTYKYTSGISLTITFRGTEFVTISLTLPGAQPLTIVSTRAEPVARAVRESYATAIASGTVLPGAEPTGRPN